MEDVQSNPIDSKLDTKIQNKKVNRVSDREILSIIKEDKHFPVEFSSRIKLSKLVKYYHKYWNNEFTDESSEDESDEIPCRSIFDNIIRK